MHHGTVLRSLTNATKFGAVHLKAQYYMMTGYLFPVGLKAPGMGAVVGRTLGPRAENVPPYIYIGREERAQYGPDIADRFDGWSVAFEGSGVRIVSVPDVARSTGNESTGGGR